MKLRQLGKYLFTNPIKPPPNPKHIVGAKLTPKELEELMNPLGFLKENEQVEVNDQIAKAKELKELIDKFKSSKVEETEKKPYQLDKNGMPPEVGFKVKGLEPTRYGDWIGRGRVTDF